MVEALTVVSVALAVCGTVLAALQIHYAFESKRLQVQKEKDIRAEAIDSAKRDERNAARIEKVQEFDARLLEVEKFVKTAKWNGK